MTRRFMIIMILDTYWVRVVSLLCITESVSNPTRLLDKSKIDKETSSWRTSKMERITISW